MTEERSKTEALKLSNSFLKHGSGAAIARAEGTSRQTQNQKLRKKAVQSCIQKELNSPKYKKRWLKEMLLGAHESEKSISAVILVQKDGKLVKADDHGGIMIADRQTRHRYLHDLGLAMGELSQNGNGKGVTLINVIYSYRTQSPDSTIRSKGRESQST